MDAFSIPITLYRNAGYSMPVSLQNPDGSPYPTPGWTFRLEIVPASFDRSWASPATFAQQKVAGSGNAGTVFVLVDPDTASLDFKTSYNWRVMVQQAPHSSPSVLIGGSCTVLDSPPFPEINPLSL